MLSSIGQNNNVQRFSAVNALRTSASQLKRPAEQEQNAVSEEITNGVKLAPKGLLERVDVADIRKHAGFVGEFNISDDDIKYGLMYGRSVIAEYLC